MTRPRLALSIGCPCGVGPEVSVTAATEAARAHEVLLVGSWSAVARAAKGKGIDESSFVRVLDGHAPWRVARGRVGVWDPLGGAIEPGPVGRPRPADGAAQLAWVDAACDLAAEGHADAMVTGPVSKEIIASSGAPGSARFLGHTEHLQRRLRAPEVVMAFWNERFTTALVTTHLPIARVARAISSRTVATSTYWLARLALTLGGGAGVPRIAVCGLNPHAGEGGLLGSEEERAIGPGMSLARKRLARARVAFEGPLGAETAFRRAADGHYDGVVAMYHDQATIPMKLVGFGESVNVSLALPIVRTSVDHGTAYDIAGRGVADARGMRQAVALAARLVTPRDAASPGAPRRAAPRRR
jgi:4-hydroxythreonine-4-phosphate dehydrogenase